PGIVYGRGQDDCGDETCQGPAAPPAPEKNGEDAREGGSRGRQAHRPGVDGAAAQPSHACDQPVVQRRLLHLWLAIELARQCPVAVENRLGVLGRPALVAVPEIAVGKAVKEKDAAEQEEKCTANCKLQTANGKWARRRRRGTAHYILAPTLCVGTHG